MQVQGRTARSLRALLAWSSGAAVALALACGSTPPQAAPAIALPTLPEALERIRAAVGYDALSARPAGVQVRGRCSIEGLEGSFGWLFEPGGKFLQETRTALPGATGFDGTTCWARDATGLTRVLALGGRASTLARMDVLTHRWLAPESSAFAIAVDPRASDARTLALALERAESPWRATLFVDRASWLPSRLVSQRSAGERVFTLEDWQETLGFRLPWRMTVVGVTGDASIFEVDQVGPAPTFVRDPYEPVLAPPDDTTFDAGVPVAVEARRAASGHVLVRPALAGRELGWFVLDSGAGALCLDPDAAELLGLERLGRVSVVGAGGALPGAYRTGATLELGPLVIRGAPWVELELDGLEPLLDAELAGILGFDLFMRAVVVVDAEAERVELHAREGYELPSGVWRELRLDDRMPCVEVAFEGDRTGWFRIDTGSDDTVVFHGPAVARLGLLEDRGAERVRVGGIGGASDAHRGELAWLELGGRRFEDLPVTFHGEAAGALRSAHTAGLIGLGLLRHFVVVLDCAGGRAAFLERGA